MVALQKIDILLFKVCRKNKSFLGSILAIFRFSNLNDKTILFFSSSYKCPYAILFSLYVKRCFYSCILITYFRYSRNFLKIFEYNPLEILHINKNDNFSLEESASLKNGIDHMYDIQKFEDSLL